MTTPTTTDLRTMLDQATPGPWVWEHWDGNDDNICRILHWRQAPAYAIGDRVADEVDKPADARLIAAAPDLCAEVIRLREAIERMADQSKVEADQARTIDPISSRAFHRLEKALRALLEDQS